MIEAEGYSRARFIRNVVTAGLIEGALLMYPYFAHPIEAQRAFDALGPGYLDCGPGLTIQSAQGVLVPGGGMKVNELGKFIPNAHENERLMVAAELYKHNPKLYIFLLDGPPDPNDPLQGQTVVDALQDAYKLATKSDKEIPADKIVRGLTSINTATNMEEPYRLARELDLESFLMVTQAYHMDRSVLFACNNGLHVTPRLVESILDIERGYPFLTEFKERAEVLFAYIDTTGQIPALMKANHKDSKQNDHSRRPLRQNSQEIWHEKIISRNKRQTTIFHP